MPCDIHSHHPMKTIHMDTCSSMSSKLFCTLPQHSSSALAMRLVCIVGAVILRLGMVICAVWKCLNQEYERHGYGVELLEFPDSDTGPYCRSKEGTLWMYSQVQNCGIRVKR